MCKKVPRLMIALTLASLFAVEGNCQFGRYKKNYIDVAFATHHFFDGQPIVWKSFLRAKGYVPVPHGISYTRLFENNSGFNIMVDDYVIGYDQPDSTRKIGTIGQRTLLFISFYYLHPLVMKDQFAVWLLGGTKFRLGYQYYYTGPKGINNHSRHYYHTLGDLGISPGVRFVKFLPWNFTVSAEASYSYYVYMHYFKRNVQRSIFETEPTRNLLSIYLKFGYSF